MCVCVCVFQVKVWNTNSGLCFVTFTEHTSSVTNVTFTSSGFVVVSASLDGTVCAFDLHRYIPHHLALTTQLSNSGFPRGQSLKFKNMNLRPQAVLNVVEYCVVGLKNMQCRS